MKNNVKLTMQKSFDINLLTKFWRTFFASQILEQKIFKYIKLVELVVVQVISSIKDEWFFFTFTFMKIKLNNQSTKPLELVILMFSQKVFTMQNFPFGITIQNWKENRTQYGLKA